MTTRTITDPEQWTIGDHATVTHRDGAVTVSRARVEALCRLLADEGHMTPMAKRQISRLWDESRVTIATERWVKDGRWCEVKFDAAGVVLVSIELFRDVLTQLGFSRMDES